MAKGVLVMGRTTNKDTGHSFEDYFKRATSPMMALLILNEKPMYVYKLSRELEKRSNRVMLLNILRKLLKVIVQEIIMKLLMQAENI